MITFFRKIRQKLLTDLPVGKAGSSFSKYLLYTLGEIVFEIIVAFRLNLGIKMIFFPSWEGTKGWVVL